MSTGRWLFYTILIIILFYLLCYFSSFLAYNVVETSPDLIYNNSIKNIEPLQHFENTSSYNI